MISKKNQIHNSLIYMVPTIIGVFLPIISLPIFTRFISPEEYGVLAIILIYAIFMSGIANFGLTLIFERNYFKYSKNFKKLSQLLYSSLIFVFASFSLLYLTTYIFSKKISLFLVNSEIYGDLILIAFLSHFIIGVANVFYFTYYKNEGNAKAFSTYKVYLAIGNFVLSVYFIVYLGIGIYGIVISQLIVGLVLFIFLFKSFLKRHPFLFSKVILIDSLKISYPLTPRIFFGVAEQQFDKYLISIMATLSGVGVYHVGKNISQIVFSFMNVLQNVFQPQVYKMMFADNELERIQIGPYLTPFFYISVLIAFLVSLLSFELIVILTPEGYHGAVEISIIFSVYYGFLFFGTVPQLMYMKKSFILTSIFIFRIIFNILITIPFIIWLGVVGAAWATVFTALVFGVISLTLSQYYYYINYEWKKILAIYFVFISGSLSMIFIDITYIQLLYLKIIYLFIYLFLGVHYKILTKENFGIIKSFLFK